MTPQERDLLIRTVIGEAAGQPLPGQAAVAHVALNRLNSGRWGDNMQKVLFAPKQFEPWDTRRGELMAIDPNSPKYQSVAGVVDQVLGGQMADPTGGATHFLNENIVRQRRGGSLPNWASGQGQRIGDHTFYSPEGAVQAINKASPMQNAPQGMTAYSDEDIARILTGQPPAARVPAAAPAAPAALPSPMAGLPVWALPAGMQGQQSGGMSDDEIFALLTGGATPKAADPKKAVPATGGAIGTDLARMAPEGDTLGAKLGRGGVGLVRGIGDVADTLAQGIAFAGDKGANLLQKAGVIAPETAQGVTDWRSRINQDITADNAAYDAALGDSGMATAGRIGGNIAGTALPAGGAMTAAGAIMRPGGNLLMQAARGGAQGAAGGAAGSGLTSAASEAPLLDQLKSGATAGAAFGAAAPIIVGGARGATNAIMGSSIGQETARLAQMARERFAIPVTAGSMSESPAVRFLEGTLKKLPFSGYGKQQAAERTAFNRAVGQTFGEDVERITPEVIRQAKKRIGAEFDEVAAGANIVPDRPFIDGLGNIARDVVEVLPQAEREPIRNQIMKIAQMMDRDGSISGDTFIALTRKGAPLQQLQKSSNPNTRHYANQIRDLLEDAMERSSPTEVAERLAMARSQYRNLKAVEPLAKKATTGDISPALLLNKAGDRGELFELGRIGQRFLKEAPSSGTSERNWWQNALGVVGGGAAGAYGLNNPDQAALGAGGLAAMLAAGRGAGAIMRSDRLANRMITNALAPAAGGGRNRLLEAGLPVSAAVINERSQERKPLRITISGRPPAE